MHTQQGRRTPLWRKRNLQELQETESWFSLAETLQGGRCFLLSCWASAHYHPRAPSSGLLTLTEVSVHSSVDCGIRSLILPPNQFADKSAILTHIGKFWSVFSVYLYRI